MQKDAYVRKQEKRGILKIALTTEHNRQEEDEKDKADHVSNKNEETNNAHYMSDDDWNAFDILAWCTLTT